MNTQTMVVTHHSHLHVDADVSEAVPQKCLQGNSASQGSHSPPVRSFWIANPETFRPPP
jgi:hypothetical protein